MKERSSSATVSTKLQRIATLAQRMRDKPLTTLAHHIDLEWLREAYRRTRKDGATGVDGQTSEQYAADLEGNLQRLLDRAKSGTYRAPPVRRAYIPKGNGEKRPLGIPTFEDKVLQRAVAMLLEALYEQEFLACSYGFRPGRSAHQALDALQEEAMRMYGGWVVEIDIRKYFDTIDHGQLREVLRRRVRDGVILRLVDKWLNAGVMEDSALSFRESGTPQGGVMTPLTQLTTRSLAGCPSAWRWLRTGGRLRRRKPIDDRRAALVDLHLRDQRADDVPAFNPRNGVEPLSHSRCEVCDLGDDGTHVDCLAKLSVRIADVAPSPLDPCTHGFAPRLELCEFDRADFVGIKESLQGALVNRDISNGLVAMFAKLGGNAVALLAARPLVEHTLRILQELADRLPDVAIELIDADLRVAAHASAREAVGVSTDTAVVRVALASLRGGLGDGLPVEGVAATRADRQSLEQIPLTARVSLREMFVACELQLGCIEDILRHDRGHVDRNPLFGRLITMRAFRTTWRDALPSNRSQQLSVLGRFGLAEGSLAHVRRVLKDRPYCCAIPSRCTSARRDLLRVEVSYDLSDRFLLADERVKDAPHDLRLVKQHTVASWRVVRLLDVREAIRRATHRIDRATARAMNLAAPAALENLRALVLRDHALHLHEQLVLGRLTCGAVQKHRYDPVPSEFVQQQHLVSVLASETIGTVHVENLDGPFSSAIAKSLERGTHERGAADALVDVDILRKNEVTIGLGALLERGDLTLDGRLLRLLFRRDTRVQGDRFHRAPPRCRGATSSSRVRPRVATMTSSSAPTTTRSTTGVTTSYTSRRWSADRRVGENATRIANRRRMEDDTLHDSATRSRNRQTGGCASRLPAAIARATAENVATYAAAPLEVCNCVGGAMLPPWTVPTSLRVRSLLVDGAGVAFRVLLADDDA
jgi:hypothetical protein